MGPPGSRFLFISGTLDAADADYDPPLAAYGTIMM
jgi:hypothetical protein